MKNIILASASPRRKDLLELINLKFEIIPSNVEEILDDNLPLGKRIEKLAFEKANWVANKFSDNRLIIGADTIVEIDGKILGKPKDKIDAKDMLMNLSGTTHNVITAISLIQTGNNKKTINSHEITKVSFKALTEKEIENYINTGEPMDKAGSYAIQGIGVMIVNRVEGCYTNVIGLPIPLLTRKLSEEFDINLL